MSNVGVATRPPPDAGLKRKRPDSRSPQRSPSPQARRRRSTSPPAKVALDLPRVADADPVRRKERERQLALQMAKKELEPEEEKPKFDAQAEFAKLIGSRSGGVYVPPARLRAMQAAAAQDKASAEYQRLSWDALRKSITGIVNRVNVVNIKNVVPELFAENLVRGKGLFARAVMRAQAASLPFTPVFAALVAIVNTKLPQVGELLLIRLVSQFRRAFKRNDKIICHSSSTFIAHLVNQAVAHEIIALQVITLLLERPTDDSVEIAVGFMREVGAFLAENAPKANGDVFDLFRAVLHESTIDKRVQYMIEVLFQVRKDKYKDNPILPEGLDLVPEEDQITHRVQLDDELQVQDGLNIFKFDPEYLQHEEMYKELKAEILGEGSDEESGSEEDDSGEDEEAVEDKEGIEDRTGTNVVNLRRVIYLTIMNSLNFEEAVHKLMKIDLPEGQEIELCNMVIECCSQERSYSNFYGLIGERFSKLNRVWCESFEEAFRNYFETIHRYETNRLRNIGRFFGHLLSSDSISWAVFSIVRMNEDDTTSSSRIFIKILLQEMTEEMGLKKLAERFAHPDVKIHCAQMFPMDNPKNTRFSINYFTSIGLGAVTEEMREHLKNVPKMIMEQRRAMLENESPSSDSDSSDSDSDSDTASDSDSDSSPSDSSSDSGRRSRSRTRSPPRRSRKRHSNSPPRRYDNRDRRDESPRRESTRDGPRRGDRSRERRETGRGDRRDRSRELVSPRRRPSDRTRPRSPSRSPSREPTTRKPNASPRRRDDGPRRRSVSPGRRSPPRPRGYRADSPGRGGVRDDSGRDRDTRRDRSPEPSSRPGPGSRARDVPPHMTGRHDRPPSPRHRRSRSPPPRRRDSRSPSPDRRRYARDRPSRSRSRDMEESPRVPKRRRDSRSRSKSPPRKKRRPSSSRSRSRSPPARAAPRRTSRSRSRPRSHSRSRSPPARGGGRDRR